MAKPYFEKKAELLISKLDLVDDDATYELIHTFLKDIARDQRYQCVVELDNLAKYKDRYGLVIDFISAKRTAQEAYLK